MRPRLLTDDMILSVIADLAVEGRVTGVAVRRLLAQRYGAKGSVARIYRLMGEAHAKPPLAPPRAVAPADPRAVDDALARVALAEERERVHQVRWARETDALRARLQDAEQGARDVPTLRLKIAELQRSLGVAQRRIEELESALRSKAGDDVRSAHADAR